MSSMQNIDELKRKELEEKIRKRVGCEERAFRVVERLLDDHISEDKLKDAAWMITPSHYADITEERAISRLCGYPICPNSIPSMPKQKYHISVKQNKVFNITERKNFCSNQCYQGSKYFEKQIPTSPVWERENERPPHFDLLPLGKTRGRSGEEVLVNPAKAVQEELRTIEQLDQYFRSSQEENLDQSKEKKSSSSSQSPSQSSSQSSSLHQNQGSEDISINHLDTASVRRSQASVDRVQADVDLVSEAREQNDLKLSEKVEHLVKKCEQLTVLDSDDDDDDDEDVDELNLSASDREMEKPSLVSCLANRLLPEGSAVKLSDDREIPGQESVRMAQATCEKKSEMLIELKNHRGVHTRESISKSSHAQVTSGGQSENCEVSTDQHVTPPGDSLLKPENQGLGDRKSELKSPRAQMSAIDLISGILKEWKTNKTVDFLNQFRNSSFLNKTQNACSNSGDHNNFTNDRNSRKLPEIEALHKETEMFSRKVTEFYGKKESGGKVSPEDENGENETDVILPLVDSQSQMAFRRKIVLERLNKVIPDLLVPLKLTIQDVSGDIRQLVGTFRLSSTNITLKPAEWSLMGFVLLKILAYRNECVDRAFMHNSCVYYFCALLQRIGIAIPQIDAIVSDMKTYNATITS